MKTTLIDPGKELSQQLQVNNIFTYVWKLLTTQIKEEICYLLEFCGLFPEEQK